MSFEKIMVWATSPKAFDRYFRNTRLFLEKDVPPAEWSGLACIQSHWTWYRSRPFSICPLSLKKKRNIISNDPIESIFYKWFIIWLFYILNSHSQAAKYRNLLAMREQLNSQGKRKHGVVKLNIQEWYITYNIKTYCKLPFENSNTSER